MRVDFVSHDDAASLRTILRALPAESRIISVYCRGGSHFAWVELPGETAKEVQFQETKVAPSETPRRTKKGK